MIPIRFETHSDDHINESQKSPLFQETEHAQSPFPTF